jgi:hypothetical protein
MTTLAATAATFITALAIAAGLPAPGLAQTSPIPSVHRQLVSAIEDSEAAERDWREAKRLEREHQRQSDDYNRRVNALNIKIADFRLHCSQRTSTMHLCPGLSRDIDAMQAQLDPALEQLERRGAELDREFARARDSISRANARVGDAARALAAVCRAALGLERTSECYGRNYSGMSGDALAIIRRHLPERY